jgi:site-specific DNA-methyltransferase (adenine-specific)
MKLLHGDCLELLPTLADGSVDLVLTDPPYGTTACVWDAVIPFEPMWAALRRVIKPNRAVVMTASQPFTSALIMSNAAWFKYCWVWRKSRPSGFAQARNMPLKDYEDVAVFSEGVTVHASQSVRRMPYNPQGLVKFDKPKTYEKKSYSDSSFSKRPSHGAYQQEEGNFPRQVLDVASESGTVHPTQKPVALMEYLIRTYTNPGETVLDFTMGSGTTGVACANTGRKFIGIERDPEYFAIAQKRIADAMGVFG